MLLLWCYDPVLCRQILEGNFLFADVFYVKSRGKLLEMPRVSLSAYIVHGGDEMSKYKNGENGSLTETDNQALQNALEDAEQALAGDPLQEAVKQKKNDQQFK